MSEIIACPSGLTGRVRKMKVAEARNFSSRKLAQNGDPIGHLLQACWEETIDPGPYQTTDSGIDWDKVLLGNHLQRKPQHHSAGPRRNNSSQVVFVRCLADEIRRRGVEQRD